MAIKEYASPFLRKYVACIGAMPPALDLTWFERLEFMSPEVSEVDLDDDDFLSACTTVVLSQNPQKPLAIAHCLRKNSVRLLNFGCQIIVRVPRNGRNMILNTIDDMHLPASGLDRNERDALGGWWLKTFEGEAHSPHVRVYSGEDWQEVLKLVVSHPAEQPPNRALQLEATSDTGEKLRLDNEDVILLQRAFWDCKKVHLKKFSDGLSGDGVYRAYAEGIEVRAGTRPSSMMYFVKVGHRVSIALESEIYVRSIRPYIPFHLGPHLADDRCFLGVSRGLIVGDYVRESESLRSCANTGRAASALACLFDRTLQGWYRDAETKDESIVDYLLRPQGPLKNVTSIPDARNREAKQLGLKLDLADMLGVVRKYCHSKKVLIGRVHGDLHPGNVLVRGSDAILIDFEKHKAGMPLLYDPATLEAGLLIDGFKEEKGAQWLNSIMPLYDGVPFHSAALETNPLNTWHWFYECVRQIRTYAFHMEREVGQYATALVVALLKKGSKCLLFSEAEQSRRAGLLVIAERILLNIQTEKNKERSEN